MGFFFLQNIKYLETSYEKLFPPKPIQCNEISKTNGINIKEQKLKLLSQMELNKIETI